MLETRNLTKSFGGLMVTNSVSMKIREGELSAIIGPNGAGKTTLFNLLTGHLKPDSGSVLFKGNNIAGLPPYKISRMGIGRSFQHINIFPKLKVIENVQAAILARKHKMMNFVLPSKRMFVDESMNILSTVRLDNEWNNEADLLPYGDQKRLEIGIALGLRPSLLFLDEPTAGMSPGESKGIADLIEKVVHKEGLTALFVEHDMGIVFGIAKKIRVLHLGEIIVEGTPEEIKENEQVQRIYLGE